MESSTQSQVEIVKNRLYWISSKKEPKGIDNAFFFNVDDQIVYYPFFKDFGPHNISNTVRYVRELNKLLESDEFKGSVIYHHTSHRSRKRTNSAFLMGAYQVLVLGATAEEAWKGFQKIPAFRAYRDALRTKCTYKCTILDCLRGLEFAQKIGWFSLKTFDVKEAERDERVENGDMNWIIPGKFLAVCTPYNESYDEDGYPRWTPNDYIPVFKAKGINTIIRLNKACYDKELFIKQGFKFHDIYFRDGTTPDYELVQNFIKITEEADGPIAVHCKAGLGRTGTMICMYLMKHYKMPASIFIGWTRICRPGSVLGPQQEYLNEMQEKQTALASNSKIFKSLDKNVRKKLKGLWSVSPKLYGMNEAERRIQEHGQEGQGDDLNDARRNR